MGPAIDPDGEIVSIRPGHRFAYVDTALRRIHPKLQLGYDRRFKNWVVGRLDVETIRCGELGDRRFLTYLRPHFTVIVTWTDRLPNDALVAAVASLEAERLERDQSRWVERKLLESGLAREEHFNRRSKQLADAFADEVDASGCLRGRTTVGYEP